ncbi:MAG TPA: glycosyltransferase family 87 protein [Caulobacteraceae bacterium]|nr:glycosyltransferase family 87 protein [Caulobacteraceae bacterium]
MADDTTTGGLATDAQQSLAGVVTPVDSRPRPSRGLFAAAAALAAALGTINVGLIVFKLPRQPLFIDFLAMWTGGRFANADPARLYDFAAVDRAQAWLLGAAAHDRPFPYPPSALLLFSPLARLPFWIAAWLWMAAGLAAFAGACALALPRKDRWLAAVLTPLLPAAAWAGISGQCCFLLGGAAIAGVALLNRRPTLAGMLIGLAAAIKPSVLVMAPLALAAAGRWRALAFACLAGGGAVAVSAALFGLGPWLAWVKMAGPYLSHMAADRRYAGGIVAPGAMGARLGLTGPAEFAWRTLFVAAGAALAALAFPKAAPLEGRLTAFLAASLLASPYAMNYETLPLAPGAVLALITAEGGAARWRALAALALLAAAGLPTVGGFALITFVTVSLWPAGRRARVALARA